MPYHASECKIRGRNNEAGGTKLSPDYWRLLSIAVSPFWTVFNPG
jgi:hypothetical protein